MYNNLTEFFTDYSGDFPVLKEVLVDGDIIRLLFYKNGQSVTIEIPVSTPIQPLR